VLAVTIPNPWAYLVTRGEKCVLDLDWRTDFRGRLAIHSSSSNPLPAWRGMRARSRLAVAELGFSCPAGWPRGRLLAVAELSAVLEVPPLRELADVERWLRHRADELDAGTAEFEELLGDWKPGRFAWFLTGIEALTPSLPIEARSGLWETTATAERTT